MVWRLFPATVAVGAPFAIHLTTDTMMRVPFKIYRDPRPLRRSSKYPFSEMEIGDCFYVPLAHVSSPRDLASAAKDWAKSNGSNWKFVVREADDQLGVWRVS